MKRLFFTLVAAAAVATALLVTSGTAVSGQVSTAGKKFVTHDCFDSRMRPKLIDLTCHNSGKTGNLERLKWKSWGGKRARARGKYIDVPQKQCFPRKCGTSKLFPVKVKLKRPRPCSSKGGKQHYRKAVIRFTKGKPKGYRRTDRQRINCPVNF